MSTFLTIYCSALKRDRYFHTVYDVQNYKKTEAISNWSCSNRQTFTTNLWTVQFIITVL